jgi:molecular chaperone GrpE
MDIIEPLAMANKQKRSFAHESRTPSEVSSEIQGNASSSLDTQLAAERDKYLRLAADFENFRKRTARESGRRSLELKDAFIRDLLPVVDNLERAVAGIPASQAALYEGVKMTLEQLLQLLRQHGFEPERSFGQAFDPHRHEAMAVRANPQFPENTVLEVWSRGWRRGEEIFRPAKVVVNSFRPPTSGEGST